MASKSKKTVREPHEDTLDFLRADMLKLHDELDALIKTEIKANVVKYADGKRFPGRFKGALVVGPEFFEPLTKDELKEFNIE